MHLVLAFEKLIHSLDQRWWLDPDTHRHRLLIATAMLYHETWGSWTRLDCKNASGVTGTTMLSMTLSVIATIFHKQRYSRTPRLSLETCREVLTAYEVGLNIVVMKHGTSEVEDFPILGSKLVRLKYRASSLVLIHI